MYRICYKMFVPVFKSEFGEQGGTKKWIEQKQNKKTV
jgi:hypothetical protein